jgi:hypothetical protein
VKSRKFGGGEAMMGGGEWDSVWSLPGVLVGDVELNA